MNSPAMNAQTEQVKEGNDEKSQEQIRYENICLNLITGDYSNYLKHPNSVGQVCQYLKAYGFHNYDRVQVGFRNDIGSILFGGKVMATYRIVEDAPVFTFDSEHDWLKESQDIYLSCKDKFPNPFITWYNSIKKA